MSEDNATQTLAEPDSAPPALNQAAGIALWPGGRRVPWYVLAYVLVVLVALVLRLWDLGDQSIHHDESLHAVYSWYLYAGRGYEHSPMMHGPFQFFGTAAVYWLLWDGNATARLLPALMGTVLVGLPLLLRGYLGRSGALITSFLIAVSPTMLYFSRFARNDVYMAVWTLALIAFMWRYIDTKRVRYLVLASVVLALSFATKETSYILVAILGSYLFFQSTGDVLPWLVGRKSLQSFSPAGEFLVLMGVLTLPLGAAGIALFQDRLGVTLANPDWQAAPVGIPIGTGLYVAFFVGAGLVIAAAVIGVRWRPKVWLVCFAVFVTVWGLLYTSFFTNPMGSLSGLWQGLGYWVVQQDVARGGQPWYYYLVIGMNYEFLPLVIGGAALGIYMVKGDKFSRFLVYWAIATVLAYTAASEKMPWLLVGVSLPFFLLAGKLLGRMVERRPWSRLWSVAEDMAGDPYRLGGVHWPAVGFSAMALLLVAAGGWWLLLMLSESGRVGAAWKIALGVLTLTLALNAVVLYKRVASEKRTALVGLSLAVVMLSLAIPSALRVSYANADVPVEMLVYTQTSPDIPQIMAEIERLGEETGKGLDLKLTVDSTDGYSWPWAWYLRDYTSVGYPCLSDDAGCQPLVQVPDADVVLVSARNNANLAGYLTDYSRGVKYRHRWWFPETYRGLNPKTIFEGVQKRETWCRVVSYFLGRDLAQGLGSSDGYVYFPEDFVPAMSETDPGSDGMKC